MCTDILHLFLQGIEHVAKRPSTSNKETSYTKIPKKYLIQRVPARFHTLFMHTQRLSDVPKMVLDWTLYLMKLQSSQPCTLFMRQIVCNLPLKTGCIQRAWEYCSSRQPQATQASIFMGANLLSRKNRFLIDVEIHGCSYMLDVESWQFFHLGSICIGGNSWVGDVGIH